MSAFIDTNVLIRHFTGDPPELAARAVAYLRAEPELFLSDLVVAETVYVLGVVLRGAARSGCRGAGRAPAPHGSRQVGRSSQSRLNRVQVSGGANR